MPGSNISYVSAAGSHVYHLIDFVARPYWIGHLNAAYGLPNGTWLGLQSENFNVSYDDVTPFTWGASQLATATATISTATIGTVSATSTNEAPVTGTTAAATSASTAAASSSGGGGIGGGAIAGIVIGVIALLALLGATTFFLGRRSRRRRDEGATATPLMGQQTAYQQQQPPPLKHDVAPGEVDGTPRPGELPASHSYVYEAPSTNIPMAELSSDIRNDYR